GMIKVMDTDDSFIGPINIGNPDEFSIIDLAEKVIRLTGSKSRIVKRDLPMDDPRQRKPDITLAKILLEWEPKIKFDDGLERTIDYFRNKVF
ncbi:MAG TPA: SDR family NAD-dependent epimerase/dehydratase, partial [Bacteroidales bacterium]|nr:SDR family NAD-dependent epimerase/dehydratase [Bacteroidales bacterium]